MALDNPAPLERREALTAQLTLTARSGRLEISRRRPLLLSAMLPLLCCFGPCAMFGEGLVAGTVEDGDTGRYLRIPWLGYLMLACCALGSALLVYLFVASLVNRIILRIEPGRLRLFNTPLPWPPGSVDLGLEEIIGFESTPGLRIQQGKKELVKPTFILLVTAQGGRRHPLVPGLESEEQSAWLAGEIRRTLGLPAPAASPWPAAEPAREEPSPMSAHSVEREQEPGSTPPAGEDAPRSLPERLIRGLIAHGLGYLATSQQVYAVGGHFGWFMLVLIGLQDGGRSDLMKEASQALLTLYATLGGVNENGRGGIPEMMGVWSKVTLFIYLIELLLSRVLGSRRPWGVRRKWAASTALACAGYGVAFALLSASSSKLQGTFGDMLWVISLLVLFTSGMTLWALNIGGFVRSLQAVIRGAPARDRRTTPPTNDSIRPLLVAGGGVLALGLAVGLVMPRKHVTSSPGVAAEAGRSCRTAPVCERRCDQGDASACNLLSELLEHGLGVERDSKRSHALATRACDLGDGIACMRLANALDRGAPTREDLQQADALYRRSCELKNADGCAGVAYLYMGVRDGPPKNPEIVNRFFTRACELGNQEACARLGSSAPAE